MNKRQSDNREKQITRTSIVGIIANIFLAGFKAAAGWIAGSLAIVLDAVNNLTDALSSIITIIGIKLAKRRPDKKHPFGHGRIEYFSAIIIAAIVLSAGVMSFVESAKKIIGAAVPDYSTVTLIIICVAIVTKLILGRFVKRQGVKYNSDALVASGSDASFDAILSATTLLGAIITLIWGISVDGIVGVIISVFIIKAGLEMLMRPVHRVIGARNDSEVTKGIRHLIKSIDGVEGVYDLFLHDYGPDYAIGSVHVEVPDTMTAKDIHVLTKKIQASVYSEYSVFLTVGIYAVDTQDKELFDMRQTIERCALSHGGILNVHGIFILPEIKSVQFDIVVDFKVTDREELVRQITEEILKHYPEYHVRITLDTDYSD